MTRSGEIPQLPVFVETTYEDHVSAYSEVLQRESANSLDKGAIASSARAKFGRDGLEKLAWEIGEEFVTLWRNADVHDRLSALPEDDLQELVSDVYNGALSYTHIRDAHDKVKDDVKFIEILEEAQTNGWRTKRLREEIAVRAMFEANGSKIPTPPPDVEEGWQDDHPRERQPVSRAVAGDNDIPFDSGDPHLKRLVRSIEHTCRVIEERNGQNGPETLAYVSEMRQMLERLESKLMGSNGRTPAKEGGDMAGVVTDGS